MGVAPLLVGSGGLGLIGGGFAAKNRLEKDAAHQADMAQRQQQADAAHQAESQARKEEFIVAPDLADAMQSKAVAAEARRLRSTSGRAGSFLTGPGGTLANKTLLTGGLLHRPLTSTTALSPATTTIGKAASEDVSSSHELGVQGVRRPLGWQAEPRTTALSHGLGAQGRRRPLGWQGY